MQQASATKSSVLVLESSAERAAQYSSCLRYLDYKPVLPSEDPSPAKNDSAVAILVGKMRGAENRAIVERLASHYSDLPIIVIDKKTAIGVEASERQVWRTGKRIHKTLIARLLRQAQRYQGIERRRRIVGNSNAIRRVKELIEIVAEFQTNVLIAGDSGTGKELVARTIHGLSDRSDKPFVPINCGAIPSELLESELFGHEKGAFTGAISTRKGRFELAEGGTLFLDEIGDMSLTMQVKLLRVLQERQFEPVGASASKECDVRIIAATHRDLPEAVAKGEFRADLYYRLNVFPIEMPALCKRLSDIPLLLEELLERQGEENGSKLRLSAEALSALANYSWPGNVRELHNLVERLAIMYPSGEIGLSQLPEKFRTISNSCVGGAELDVDQVDVQALMRSKTLKSYLQELESGLIEDALTQSNGVTAKAARMLNLQRTTLVEKIARYNLTVDSPESATS